MTEKHRIKSNMAADEIEMKTTIPEDCKIQQMKTIEDLEKNNQTTTITAQKSIINTTTPMKNASGSFTRNQWTNQLDFLFSVIGFAVDLSNVFRFPYICYSLGGGAFLIPYFLMNILISLPMLYLEMVIGQYMRCGGLSIWKVTPLFRGVGWASIILTFYVALYYNVIIAWAFHYIFVSFLPQLPWTKCGNSWNSEFCQETNNNWTKDSPLIDPSTEYFENSFLGINKSSGLGDLGPIKWDMMVSVLGVYIIIYFCLFKGVKTLGKAVWVTAILPYIVLTILLVRGVLLEGSLKGIIYFIKPDFSKLLDLTVWFQAASQILFSVGVGFSVHIAYSSYNSFHQPSHRDCLIAAGVNSFTSLFSGFVVFSYLGHMSIKMGKPINTIAQPSLALIFIVYPQALATLPFAQFWSVVFFLMLFTLGLDSSFGALEAFITGIMDEFDFFLNRFKYKREICTGILMIVLFVLSLPNTTYGGFYIINLLDEMSVGLSLITIVLLECIGFIWFYGIQNVVGAVQEMNGFTLHFFIRFLLKYISPIMLLLLTFSQFFNSKELVLELSNGRYYYPEASVTCSRIFSFSSLVIVVAVGLWISWRTPGDNAREKLAILISPNWEHEQIRMAKTCSRFQKRHWLTI